MTEQFKRLHQELRGGGFSEHLPTGSKPSSGFMVSDYGTEQKIPAHLSSPQLLETYAAHHGLGSAPEGEHMGGWANRDNQTDYLDVSRKYDNPAAGKFAMITQNQESMYDASKTPDHPDAYVDNPHFDPDFKESAPGDLEQNPTWLRPFRGERPNLRTVPKERQ